MFLENARNYRLRRTLPKLSGNMQIDLIVALGADSKLYVQQAHLRPISPLIPYVPIVDERLMDRPHHLNIKEFYKKTISGFFTSPIEPNLKMDWPWMISNPEMERLKYLKNWDDTYWAGTKRMAHKLYGTTHECLVPVWLDQCQGLRFKLTFMGGENTLTAYELDISKYFQTLPKNEDQSFHNDFVDYFMEYLDYINITTGNIDVMSVDFKHNQCTVTGLQPESGNMIVRKNYNVARNLMYRERPLLEANSLITNTFPDMKLICPHLINFNICFDLEDMYNSKDLRDIVSGVPNMIVKVDVETLRQYSDLAFNNVEMPEANDWVWEKLEVRDFYTNHDYIPRPMAQLDYNDGQGTTYRDFAEEDHLNALDYKGDYNDLSMMHQNKMVQPICHWVHATQPDGDLFNLYDGFGAYAKVGDKIVEWNHGFGTTTDPSDTEYDRGLDNTIWAGAPRVGDGDDIEQTLDAAQHWIDNGYFKDASNFINGLKFNYNPNNVNYNETSSRVAPRKVYIGTMTTPWDTNAQSWKTMATSLMTSQHFVGILTERISSRGGSDLPKGIADRNVGTFDDKYDYHYHSDADNRWHITSKDGQALYIDPTGEKIPLGDYAIYTHMANGNPWGKIAGKGDAIELKQPCIRIGGEYPMNTNVREHDNTASLYIAMRRVTGADKIARPDDPLCVIFWHPRAKKEGKASTSDGVIFEDMMPNGLTLGGVISAVTDYLKKYRPMWLALKKAADDGTIDGVPPGLPDMSDLEVVDNVMNTIQIPDVIYFNKSIIGRPNTSISTKAQETDYFKLPETNEYVWRYSNKIKPAIFPDKFTGREGDVGVPIWADLFGRNFIYTKKMIWPYRGCFPMELATYINTGVPPKYPSLGYETISPMVITAPNRTVPKGDIMYNEPHPKFYGLTLSGQSMNLLDLTFGSIGSELLINSIANSESYARRFGIERSNYANDAKGKALYINAIKNLPLRGSHKDIDHYDNLADTEKVIVDNYLISNNLYQYFKKCKEYDTWAWFEYKWFDKSTVTMMPLELKYVMGVDNNDKDSLEQAALEVMVGIGDKKGLLNTFKFGDSGAETRFDLPYLKSLYDFDYNLQEVNPVGWDEKTGKPLSDPTTKQVLYKYKYKIIATLK